MTEPRLIMVLREKPENSRGPNIRERSCSCDRRLLGACSQAKIRVGEGVGVLSCLIGNCVEDAVFSSRPELYISNVPCNQGEGRYVS